MRRLTAILLLGCLVLAGCGSTWREEVRYEVVCTAEQESLGSAQTKSVHTELRGCWKA
jgi:hypothetical protein